MSRRNWRPNNGEEGQIKKRVARHLRKEKREFWHIDYLLKQKDSCVKKIFYQKAPKKKECKIAEVLSNLGEAIRGFGCADCSCPSHLYRIGRSPTDVCWERDIGISEELQVAIDISE